MKQWTRRSFIVFLMLVLVLGSAMSAFADGKGKGKGNGRDDDYDFDDAALAPWAVEYMTSMQVKGVMKGYEDGNFQPNKPINQVEAIVTAVRLLGLEEQAKAKQDVKLNFKDAKLIEKKYPWAVGYIAVALEQGLFAADEDKVQPNNPASRVWTATLLVKALGKDAEAKAKMNTALTFKDTKDIPAGAVGYVAVAVESNLIEGYSNNEFRPNKPVTRAEMAALLDRLDGKLDNTLDNSKIRGSFISANPTNKTITVQTSAAASLTLALADKYYVFLDRKVATLADLRAGDPIVIRTIENKVVFISAKVEKEEFEGVVLTVTPTTVTNTVYGVAQLVVQTEDHGSQTFVLNADTKVTLDGKEVGVIGIQVGDEVEVKTVRGLVTEVEIEDREEAELEDVILKSFTIDATTKLLTTITVTAEDGKDYTLNVSSDVEIEIKGAASLQVGDKLELEIENNVVTKIEVKKGKDKDND